MTAKEKLEKIITLINGGKTIFIHTHTKTIKIDKKISMKFTTDHPVLRATEKSLYVSSGKKYDCIDFNTITMK
jgi:hypothetical protein